MNRARLARHWQEASGDPVRMAEALGDEINDPAAGLVSRDFLDARLAQLEGRVTTSMAQLEARLLKRLDSHFRWRAGFMLLTLLAVLGLYFREEVESSAPIRQFAIERQVMRCASAIAGERANRRPAPRARSRTTAHPGRC